jgi:hypothetical protein
VAYLAHIPMIKCALHGSLTIPYAPRMVNITRMSGGYIAYSLLGSTEIFIFNPSINATIKCVTESKSSIQTIICNNGVELVVIQCSGECSVFGVLDRHAFTVQKRYHTDFKHSRNYEATTMLGRFLVYGRMGRVWFHDTRGVIEPESIELPIPDCFAADFAMAADLTCRGIVSIISLDASSEHGVVALVRSKYLGHAWMVSIRVENHLEHVSIEHIHAFDNSSTPKSITVLEDVVYVLTNTTSEYIEEHFADVPTDNLSLFEVFELHHPHLSKADIDRVTAALWPLNPPTNISLWDFCMLHRTTSIICCWDLISGDCKRWLPCVYDPISIHSEQGMLMVPTAKHELFVFEPVYNQFPTLLRVLPLHVKPGHIDRVVTSSGDNVLSMLITSETTVPPLQTYHLTPKTALSNLRSPKRPREHKVVHTFPTKKYQA